jgi:hypothetical protein
MHSARTYEDGWYLDSNMRAVINFLDNSPASVRKFDEVMAQKPLDPPRDRNYFFLRTDGQARKNNPHLAR